MAFEVKIILDSVAPCGKRLTTLTATYPRFIHSEVMTHRAFARNAASSRAIPWPKMRQAIIDDPVIPLVFGSEQKGMQTGDELPEIASGEAADVWRQAMNQAVVYADELHEIGVHKSLVNRLVEPFMWITTLITATEWQNFFRLRCHPDAEIHFQKIAVMIREAMEASVPTCPCDLTPCIASPKKAEEIWHMPFVSGNDLMYLALDFDVEDIKKISVARCARVSYLTHDGKRDPQKDLELYERLSTGSGFGHWSPHEHVAEALDDFQRRSGPFFGWNQFRKQFANENMEG